MNFRKLKLEDKDLCNKLINKTGIFDSAYSFTNWFIWSDAEETTFSVQENSIISCTKNNEYMILCNPNQLDNIISDLMSKAKKEGNNSLFLYAITDKYLDFYKSKLGNKIDIKEDLGYSDYIYTVEKLKYLKGRKLSKKRNIIKKFDNLGKWEVKILNSPLTSGCDLVDSRGLKISHTDFSDLNIFFEKYFYIEKDKNLKNEKDAVYKMMKYYDELNVVGIVVYLENKLISFSAGTLLNDKMIDTHFELALPGYKGVYQLTCREFANCISLLFPSVKYINREEDMGLEGLRQAKRSYIPDITAIKYKAEIKF